MFQPDEDILDGAFTIINEGILENPHVNASFGGHLCGLIEESKIAVKHGAMMASTDIFDIKVKDKS